MIKTIFLFFILTQSILCFSQPVLTSSNTNPIVGEIYNWNSTTYPGSPGAAGASQTWDFTSLPLGANFNKYVQLPTATTAGTYFSSSSLGIDDGSGGGADYYKTYTDSLHYKGGGGGSWRNVYSNPQKLLNYPFTFSSSFIDTYDGSSNVAGTLSTFAGTIEVVADAYGTLLLPYGTLNNTLRVKSVITHSLTYMSSTTTTVSTIYAWYLPNTHQPVLVFTIGSSATAKYLSSTSLGIEIVPDPFYESSLFPNPANNEFTFRSKNPLTGTLLITDLLGKVVKSVYLNNSIETKIPLYDIPSGFYSISMLGIELEQNRLQVIK